MKSELFFGKYKSILWVYKRDMMIFFLDECTEGDHGSVILVDMPLCALAAGLCEAAMVD